MSFEDKVVAVMLALEGIVAFFAGRAWEKGQRWSRSPVERKY